MSKRRLPFSAASAVILLLALSVVREVNDTVATDPDPPAGWDDITQAAVTTLYRKAPGVPHTRWSGEVTHAFDNSSADQEQRSVLPRGMYYPQACLASPHMFDWDPFQGTWDDWDNGQYDLVVSLANAPFTFANEWRHFFNGSTGISTEWTVANMPAGVPISWAAYPRPWPTWFYTKGNSPIGSGTLTALPCPSGDPNVVQTLHSANFNTAVLIERAGLTGLAPLGHPQLWIGLRDLAGITDFEFIVDARGNESNPEYFPNDVFSSSGQGYSSSAGVLGWQTADEPLNNVTAEGCDETGKQGELAHLSNKYSAHAPDTSHAIFHIEGAPDYFLPACDPSPPKHWWEDSVGIGDLGATSYYYGSNGVALDNVSPLAETVDRLRAAPGLNSPVLEPAWFTVLAYAKDTDGDGVVEHEAPNEGYQTPGETRASIYAALLRGATGIFYFMRDNYVARGSSGSGGLVGIAPNITESVPSPTSSGVTADFDTRQAGEDLWDTIADVNSELASFESAILRPTSSVEYQVYVNDPGHLMYSMLKSDIDSENPPQAAQYLFVVNGDNTSVSVEFVFPHSATDPIFGSITEVTGATSPSFNPNKGTISATLPPFAVRTYRIVYQDADPDVDNDGCDDTAELGYNEANGGFRDPFNPWDFYDVNGDRAVSLLADIFAVADAFGASEGDPNYNRDADSGGRVRDGDDWDLKPANGVISLLVDIFDVAAQFGHDCSQS